MHIHISLSAQRLELRSDDGACLKSYGVSTARNGAGEISGSECTPRGRHRIARKIGAGLAPETIFVARQPVGLWRPALEAAEPERDFILGRILWLAGCEAGFNQGPGRDSFERYIYIHGTPDTRPMGVPLSHGCIRMRNADVLDLFERVSEGTEVMVEE